LFAASAASAAAAAAASTQHVSRAFISRIGFGILPPASANHTPLQFES
jgi:hypothetical protein